MLRACIIGHPVAHSRSPLIHNHWLSAYGIEGEYVREDVSPAAIDAFLKDFPQSGYVGGNVTVPHKEIAFDAAAMRDSVAEALGAVNTLWHEHGKLFGANTDVYGFLANLDESAPGWRERTKTALIMGAGGSARAAIHGLLERDIETILVANRTPARAAHLADHFGRLIVPVPVSDVPAHLAEADLLVNTTSLGMNGQPPLEIELSALKSGAIVYDIVYAPLLTPLLAEARARSHPTVDGLGMLLHQAVPAFERWFGVRPEVTRELREKAVADLAREGLA
ncbi:MAG TPA: shikimate dehydrogenase [Xanthobacteraceae bacterium]|nr:shikimate dehydrogenase [Xanthobacteraceae bacterium]